MAQDGLKQGRGYFDTLAEQMGQTDALFRKLASGEHPDFLTVMAGISEMVAFYTDHDNSGDGPCLAGQKESQKNCRFCD